MMKTFRLILKTCSSKNMFEYGLITHTLTKVIILISPAYVFLII